MANLDFTEFDGLFDNIGETVSAPAQTVTNTIANPVQEMTAGIQIENVNAPINPATLQAAQAKMQQIFVEMNNLFVERDELIKLMLLAVTTGTNLLMLGPPGTARVDINA